MKRRVLNYGFAATHERITTLTPFENAISVSDYDAFAYDPGSLSETYREHFLRRQSETQDLISLKGGVIICALRADRRIVISDAGGTVHSYELLDAAAGQTARFVRSLVRAGAGSHWRLIPRAKGALSGYLRVLDESLSFSAFLLADEAIVQRADGTIFAVDSVGHPIAFEFTVGAGRVCFVPVPNDIPGERVGSAIMRLVELHYGGPTELELPQWASEVSIPRARENDVRIEELKQRKSRIESEISELESARSELLGYRQLLFGYGKTILEPVVRRSFRQLGFKVLEPEEYEGEWDVDLTEPDSGKTGIGEIEGSEGVINVDKYRQLLDYFQAEILEGRVRKGILIGNGYRLKRPEDGERQSQFTEQALRGAKQNNFCLLPTTELFKAICAVLEAPENDALKIEIRNSLLSTTGVWTFARESASASAEASS